MEEFLYKELTSKILKNALRIHNDYGHGHNERIYQKLLEESLPIDGLTINCQPRIPVYSKVTGTKIGLYIPDLVVENKILIEINALNEPMTRFAAQLLEYLHTTSYEVGYLINFGYPKLYYKRFIYTNDRKTFISL